MRIIIENIGVFKYAEYELADLTIICGKNNTGKTYATYALYGFLDFFRRGYYINISEEYITQLLNDGTTEIEIDFSEDAINSYLQEACTIYQSYISKTFAAQEKIFDNSTFKVIVSQDEIIIPNEFEYKYRTQKNDFLHIVKESNSNSLSISLLLKNNGFNANASIIHGMRRIIGEALKSVIFGQIFPECFIASAERTGAVIFKDELNFQKNTLLREVVNANEIHIEDIVDKIYNTSYALPVRRNIDFIRNLESISKETGELYKNFPEIIDMFNNIVGGEYKINKEGVYFIPNKSKQTKLTIGESSSSVRSLLDVYFYLKHVAKPGQILMIDEPELNLHPESQRNLARLIASLVNRGIKVYITTHSDYIIKEINTLLMLNARKDKETIKEIMRNNSYSDIELLESDKVKMFISEARNIKLPGKVRATKIQTLTPAPIDPLFGINAYSFDNTIESMNALQESIIFC